MDFEHHDSKRRIINLSAVSKLIQNIQHGPRDASSNPNVNVDLVGKTLRTNPHAAHKWNKGLSTHILRKIVDNVCDEDDKRHCVIFDSDVNPEWVQNLSSVLDDNKLLTLPSGERSSNNLLDEQILTWKITVTSFLDKGFVKNWESALGFGIPMLIQGVKYLDPILNPVLNKELCTMSRWTCADPTR
ncbi:uncharacterized protein MELLADRAFT_110377 [Melampsora larici-populina 98AG31]|uniref:Dynein heavy chain ATP-binding dynein motor region domain-containing protein n=1 Tax=Melampsora larici-populina (strain 98AG31 / pathotype 3-4-7) TaxID=747676 RepID=F4RZL6_MELLP|nr:uncharacterized protein MELLADRAFT_110377 [Melampsora larici-populina 98AG31]EGG02025.1 hypothetical protein MELLADRAFT_110377 [Melampsora larici-populina 98AG31]